MTASELVDLAAEGALAAMPGDVWLVDRSWTRPQWTVEELEAAKAGRTISVVLPALNEEDTVESVIDSISPVVTASSRPSATVSPAFASASFVCASPFNANMPATRASFPSCVCNTAPSFSTPESTRASDSLPCVPL